MFNLAFEGQVGVSRERGRAEHPQEGIGCLQPQSHQAKSCLGEAGMHPSSTPKGAQGQGTPGLGLKRGLPFPQGAQMVSAVGDSEAF